jgi:hypothetical protein
MEKIVTLKQLKMEQLYRDYFKNEENCHIAKHVFFQCDNRLEKANKSSKIS